jgi:hypothetical protein
MTSRVAIAMLVVVTATSFGCYRTHTPRADAGADVTGPDAAGFPCEGDFNGRWRVDYAPECGSPPEVVEGDVLSPSSRFFTMHDPDTCLGEGCAPDNCFVQDFGPPACQRIRRVAWPCRVAGRNSAFDAVATVVSVDEIERVTRANIDGNVIPECRMVMRRIR